MMDSKIAPSDQSARAKESSHQTSSRPIPGNMDQADAYSYNQNQLSIERTELSKIRTELAFSNSKLAVEQTHLSYLRTIVSLIGSGATIYKALPLLGISEVFSTVLSLFLFISSGYFIYKDMTTYPMMKRRIAEMHEQAQELAEESETLLYILDEAEETE